MQTERLFFFIGNSRSNAYDCYITQVAEFSVTVARVALYKFIPIVNLTHQAHYERKEKQMKLLSKQFVVLVLRYCYVHYVVSLWCRGTSMGYNSMGTKLHVLEHTIQ